MGSRIWYLLGLCLLVACSSVRQRIAWSEYAITVNDPNLRPTLAEIDTFFDVQVSPDHPYFQASFQENLDHVTRSRLSYGNRLELLLNSASQKVKLSLIDRAKSSVFVTTYQIACDATGIEFSEALVRAAKRGVDVRIIQSDSIEQWMFIGNCGTRLQRGGVKFLKIAYPGIGRVARIHDKILLIDAEQAIVGGQNVANWHANSDGRDNNFRDTDVLVEGPAVIDVARRFVLLWMGAKPKDRSLKSYIDQLNVIEKHFKQQHQLGLAHYPDWLKSPDKRGLCRFVSQDPHLSTYYVMDAYRLMAEKAEQRLALQTLFFHVLPEQAQYALWQPILKLASRADAKVWILSNGPGYIGSKITGPVVGRLGAYLLLADTYRSEWSPQVDIFAYGSWVHSKAYFFDGAAVAIGSFNFDETSSIHTENSLICMDPSFIAEVTNMLKDDFSFSYHLTRPLREENPDRAAQTALAK